MPLRSPNVKKKCKVEIFSGIKVIFPSFILSLSDRLQREKARMEERLSAQNDSAQVDRNRAINAEVFDYLICLMNDR